MPLCSERDHAGLARVDANPLFLLLLHDEAGTAASFDQTTVSGSCRPNARGGLREVSHARPIRNSSPVLEQQAAVSSAIQSHTSKIKRADGWVGRLVVR